MQNMRLKYVSWKERCFIEEVMCYSFGVSLSTRNYYVNIYMIMIVSLGIIPHFKEFFAP